MIYYEFDMIYFVVLSLIGHVTQEKSEESFSGLRDARTMKLVTFSTHYLNSIKEKERKG